MPMMSTISSTIRSQPHQGMLTKKFHFQRAREREAVICAAHALQKIPGEATLKLLQDALRAKTKEHHEVLGAAIKALS